MRIPTIRKRSGGGASAAAVAALVLLTVAVPAAGAGAVAARAVEDPPAGAAAGSPIASIPAAGSQTADRATSISITGAGASAIGAVHVRGSRSGEVGGALAALPGGRGVVFDPVADLVEGETVTVTSGVEVPGGDGTAFTFSVARRAALSARAAAQLAEASGVSGPSQGSAGVSAAPGSASDVAPAAADALASRPDLRPSPVTIDRASTSDEHGDFFASPRATASSDQGIEVYDEHGQVVWFHPVTTPGVVSGNAFVDSYRGTPALFWFEGTAPYGPGSNRGEWIAVDRSYRELGRIRMGNGYRADVHELYLTGRGTAYLEAYHPLVCTGAGPLTDCIRDAPVLDAVVQEVDLATGAVLWEWHALDHIALADSYITGTNEFFDYLHLNSVSEDTDGNVLISGRHTSADYKVNKATGELMWSFGGKHTSFTTVTGDPETIQGPDFAHHLRAVGGNDYTYFDNGNRRASSRAAVVHLDPAAHTATYKKIIRHTPDIHEVSQGSMQTLPGGNHLVAWGGAGTVTEYDDADAPVFEATLAGGTYRTYRFVWEGAPATPPDLAAKTTGASMALSVSWNGDNRTARWRFLTGDSPAALSVATTVDRAGFETTTSVPRRAYAVAEALDAGGQVIGQSTPTSSGGVFREVDAPPVGGTYRPIVGDFAGSRNDDVLYYQPGNGKDYLHVSDGAGGFTSVALPAIGGSYETLVGDFVGDDRDDIVFYRRGSSLAYLWRFDGAPRGGTLSVASAPMLVPGTVTKAVVLENRPAYGGPRDEILWYAAGSAPDRIDHLGWATGGSLVMTSRSISVNGTYTPITGDFDGNGFADVFWYAPGSVPDSTWFVSGSEIRSLTQRPVNTPVSGRYQVVAGNLAGSADQLELAFIASGGAVDNLWTFTPSGAHSTRAATTSLTGTPLVLQGGPDRVLMWTPGASPAMWSFDPLSARPTANSAMGPGYQPLVGDFTGAGGSSSILWYAPGPAAERLFRAD